jgi:hypothetical protein
MNSHKIHAGPQLFISESGRRLPHSKTLRADAPRRVSRGGIAANL